MRRAYLCAAELRGSTREVDDAAVLLTLFYQLRTWVGYDAGGIPHTNQRLVIERRVRRIPSPRRNLIHVDDIGRMSLPEDSDRASTAHSLIEFALDINEACDPRYRLLSRGWGILQA